MSVAVTLLGGFAVAVDGVPVPPDAWARRHAAALVKLLALAPGHRLHREQVLDALWPGVDLEVATPRLHKAAHYARRALGTERAVTLRQDTVRLGGDGGDARDDGRDEVRVDVEEFEARGRAALAAGSAGLAAAALEAYGGPLTAGLSELLYEAHEPTLGASEIDVIVPVPHHWWERLTQPHRPPMTMAGIISRRSGVATRICDWARSVALTSADQLNSIARKHPLAAPGIRLALRTPGDTVLIGLPFRVRGILHVSERQHESESIRRWYRSILLDHLLRQTCVELMKEDNCERRRIATTRIVVYAVRTSKQARDRVSPPFSPVRLESAPSFFASSCLDGLSP